MTMERLGPLLNLKGFTEGAEAPVYGQLVRHATMFSFTDVYYVLVFMMLACLPLVFIMKLSNGIGPRPSVH